MKKTKAIEILSEKNHPFEVRSFDAVEFTAEEVAEKLGVPLAQVFKTLVLESDKGDYMMAVVPGDKELSLRRLAQVAKHKKVALIKINDLQRLTGYLKGGVSPVGSKKPMHVYLDETALAFPFISVSAGLRGVQLFIAADQLAGATGATVASLTE